MFPLRSLRTAVQPAYAAYRGYSSATDSVALSRPTQYGGRHTVTLIPGDGVGPELATIVQTIFKHANVPVEFERIEVHQADVASNSDALKEGVLSIRRNKVALKGVVATPIGRGSHQSFNMILRKEFDLFANVVKCRSIPGYPTRHNNVDLVVIRENTEGEYSGLEHQSVSGVVESLKVVTRENSIRIAKYAFDYATRNNRKKVTAIHKANIMKLGDGLFLNSCKEVSALYPMIKFESMIVDNCCMQLVSNPYQFDVMVMPNLYGNIVGNVGAGLVGGAGVVPGINIGHEFAIFEPGARHAAADIQGQNIANPSAMIFSATLMLRHLGHHTHADVISKAVKRVIKTGKYATRDMGGVTSSTQFTQQVLDQINSGATA
eukprot:Opistho-2@21175